MFGTVEENKRQTGFLRRGWEFAQGAYQGLTNADTPERNRARHFAALHVTAWTAQEVRTPDQTSVIGYKTVGTAGETVFRGPNFREETDKLERTLKETDAAYNYGRSFGLLVSSGPRLG